MNEQTGQEPAEEKPPSEPAATEGESGKKEKAPSPAGESEDERKLKWAQLVILPVILAIIAGIFGLLPTLIERTSPPTQAPAVIESTETPTSLPTNSPEPAPPTPTDLPSDTQSPTSPTPIQPTDIPALPPTDTPEIPPTNTATSTPNITTTPTSNVIVETLDRCLRSLDDRVVVHVAPDINAKISSKGERLPFEACFTLDRKTPDNLWVRIAQEQEDEAIKPFEQGWIISDAISEPIEDLASYFSEDARQGLYCVNSGSGLRVRTCPSASSCEISKNLLYKECLKFDGRLADSTWLQIAVEQENRLYVDLANNWVTTEGGTLILEEFYGFHVIPNMRLYFELLPIVTPPPTLTPSPTPQG